MPARSSPPITRQRSHVNTSLTSLGVVGGEEGVLERLVLHRLAEVGVHLARGRERMLDAREGGIEERV